MKKFIIEEGVFGLFPGLQIGVMCFQDINNRQEGRERFLAVACDIFYHKIKNIEGMHPHIEDYMLAMRKFKRKPASISSIDAMAKRIKRGQPLPSINPVVDLYNAVSMRFLFTCGGEDLDQIQGDMVLGFAGGKEEFIALGESKNAPPREGELVYRDDRGVVVRSWLWREADRTKITHETRNVLLYMEMVNSSRENELKEAMNTLYALVLNELGGSGKMHVLDKETPECFL